jgi:hypothetical protein
MGARFRPTRIAFTRFFLRHVALLPLAPAIILLCLGCGQSGDSSGGQVLRATGFYSQSLPNPTNTPSFTPDTTASFSLSSTVSIPGDRGDVGFIGLENLQGTSPIVTSNASLSYTIAGSSLLVPDDVFPFSASVLGYDGTSSTEVFVQLQLVSAARMNFLRANIGQLPPVPFDMTITVIVDGQNSSGDTFVSNPVAYNVTFTE